MKTKTKFGRGTTLSQVVEELKHNSCEEITRITSKEGVFTFEYTSPF